MKNLLGYIIVFGLGFYVYNEYKKIKKSTQTPKVVK